MNTPSILPIVIMLMMWVNIIYSLIVSEPIMNWEWIVTFVYSFIVCTYIAYHLKQDK